MMKKVGAAAVLLGTVLSAQGIFAEEVESIMPKTTIEETTEKITTVQTETVEVQPTTMETTTTVENSSRRTGWMQSSNNRWTYVKENGKLAKNQWIGAYYLGSDGVMLTNQWLFDANYNSWYYVKANGAYANSEWQGDYYLNPSGKMAMSQWIFDKNNNSWYYLRQSGIYAQNMWIGNYYVKANGKMAQNEWVDNDRYFVDKNGYWVSYMAPKEFTYYSQKDSRWASTYVGNAMMAQTGCMPTSIAMVLSSKGLTVTPIEVARWIHYNTGLINNDKFQGTSQTGATDALEHYGISYTISNDKKVVEQALMDGKTIIASVGPGYFFTGSFTHAIVLSGYNNGKTRVMEPLRSTSAGWYSIDGIWNQQSQDPDDLEKGGAFIIIE